MAGAVAAFLGGIVVWGSNGSTAKRSGEGVGYGRGRSGSADRNDRSTRDPIVARTRRRSGASGSGDQQLGPLASSSERPGHPLRAAHDAATLSSGRRHGRRGLAAEPGPRKV